MALDWKETSAMCGFRPLRLFVSGLKGWGSLGPFRRVCCVCVCVCNSLLMSVNCISVNSHQFQTKKHMLKEWSKDIFSCENFSS